MNALSGRVLLVTGATGFIASHLVRRLQVIPDTHLILLSRKPQRNSHRNLTWVGASLESLSPETWRAAGVHHVDIVFHLAGFTPKTSNAADDIDPIYRDNLMGTRALLESLEAVPERIVFASAVDVYAAVSDSLTLDETSPLDPISLYAASKLYCEQLVRTHARASGCRYSILRYGHAFGPGEEAYRKLIPETIWRLLRGEAPVLRGDGSARRDFLYVTDVVEATVRASISQVSELGPVNVVRGTSHSVREVVQILRQITGCSLPTLFQANDSRDFSRTFNNGRMQSLLGDWPLVSLEDGLREEVAYFKGLLS